jgi:hypothetical protein
LPIYGNIQLKKEENIMFRILCLAVVMSLALVDFTAYALEPIAIYDTFTELMIDDTKWKETETIRQIKGGKLFLSRRTVGWTGSDTGQISDGLPLSFINAEDVTAIKATVTVTQADIIECDANQAINRTRARLYGEFFNTGTPTAGSAVNDVFAQITLERRSDSPEPPGVFNVKAVLVRCTNNDCTTSEIINNVKEMGTVAVGTPVTLWMRWDAANSRFLFKRDAEAWVPISYRGLSDDALPGRLTKGVAVINNVDSCISEPTAAFIAATFDNVSVNSSAVQP